MRQNMSENFVILKTFLQVHLDQPNNKILHPWILKNRNRKSDALENIFHIKIKFRFPNMGLLQIHTLIYLKKGGRDFCFCIISDSISQKLKIQLYTFTARTRANLKFWRNQSEFKILEWSSLLENHEDASLTPLHCSVQIHNWTNLKTSVSQFARC